MEELIWYFGMFVVALVVLLKSSDFFVDAAERIGLSFGISPFIIGVTIVAFGTSLPELATGIVSTLSGNSEIVGGTVIGSNITNILLVLGVTVFYAGRIEISRNLMNLDMPILLISAVFLYLTLKDGEFSMFEGILFCIALVVFILSSLNKEDEDDVADRPKFVWKDLFIVIIAGAGVSLGATFVVKAIENISTIGGVPKEIISLTVVALGTSLPEVVVSVAAARKGKQAIAVGNVLGSNIFNTYAVIGISRLFGELKFSQDIISNSIPFMVVVTFIFALVSYSKKISRAEGAMLLILYGFYMYLVTK
jgi:cation:H+ antiporter